MAAADAHAGWEWLKRDVVSRQAQVRPSKLAIQTQSDGKRYTFADLNDRIGRCQAFLERRLSGRGARVALLARNSIHHVTLFYACARAGMIFQPLNWRLSGTEIATLLADAEAELLIAEEEFAEADSKVVRIGAQGDFADACAAIPPATRYEVDPLAPCMLLYTSGTTGRPKGVIVTPKSAFFAAVNFIHVGDLSAQHAHVCDVPLFHVIGLLGVVHPSMSVGATVHLNDRFIPEHTLALLNNRQLSISHYFCVPQMAQALVELPQWPAADLTGLRVFTGGAPISPSLSACLVNRGILHANGYGMTEAATIMHVPLDLETARRKIGSAGIPAPTMEVRLVGKDGRDVADGAAGEIWLRSPALTPGYWRQPEATAAVFKDGWLRTGDAGVRDADGFYTIVDRWKDMYITGGENVYPAEVENVLTSHGAIAEAAVIGVPDVRWGETGCAFLVLRNGQACTSTDLLTWCDQHLARYKRPTHVRFVETLPRTASGKLKKDQLRARFIAETAEAR